VPLPMVAPGPLIWLEVSCNAKTVPVAVSFSCTSVIIFGLPVADHSISGIKDRIGLTAAFPFFLLSQT
jgi:hypothetical protein